jgi:hypothetical protein
MLSARWLRQAQVVIGLAVAGLGCAQGSANISQADDEGAGATGAGGLGGSTESSTGGDATGGDARGGSGGDASGGDAGQGGLGGTGGDPGPDCGNMVVNVGEDCDDMDLSGRTCSDFLHSSGQLACDSNCVYDISDCYTCGDGAITGPEVCDGSNLDNEDCVTLLHDGGTLDCASNCLAFDEASCTDCGNSVIEGAEECDLLNLNLETCASRGYLGGTLSCDGTCNFNETACVPYQCSDVADNDGDGFTDLADPGCTSAADNDESIYAPNCAGLGGPIYDVTFQDTTQDIVITGTTAGGVNNFGPPLNGDCLSASGPEVILFYRVYTQMDIEFTFDPVATTFDTVLYIHSTDCLTPSSFICNDDYWLPPDYTSRIFVTLPPGDYYIFVDGFAGASGNFELLMDLP